MANVILQDDLIDSFAMWIVLGLKPGSFSTACMYQDRDLAYRCAHPHLKQHQSGQDIVANTLNFVANHFPRTLLEDQELMRNWHTHRGLQDADPVIKTQMRLECGRDPWFMKQVREEALDFMWGSETASTWKQGDGAWLIAPRRRTFA